MTKKHAQDFACKELTSAQLITMPNSISKLIDILIVF